MLTLSSPSLGGIACTEKRHPHIKQACSNYRAPSVLAPAGQLQRHNNKSGMAATTRSRKARLPPVAWATTALLVSSCAAFTATPASFQQHRARQRLQQRQEQHGATTGRGPWGGSRCEQWYVAHKAGEDGKPRVG